MIIKVTNWVIPCQWPQGWPVTPQIFSVDNCGSECPQSRADTDQKSTLILTIQIQCWRLPHYVRCWRQRKHREGIRVWKTTGWSKAEGSCNRSRSFVSDSQQLHKCCRHAHCSHYEERWCQCKDLQKTRWQRAVGIVQKNTCRAERVGAEHNANKAKQWAHEVYL